MAKDEIQQVFLQRMMGCGALGEKETLMLYSKICKDCNAPVHHSVEDVSFASFMVVLNKQLKPLGFELSKAMLEAKEENWYGLVNRKPDMAAKVGSKFTQHELEFFNKVVKLLVLQGGVVSSAQLLNITCGMERKLTVGAAQSFLKVLVEEKWLSKLEGKLTAGPRFILELRPFLSEICGEEMPSCKLCKEPVIQGQQCENCDTKIHLLCVNKLAGSRSSIRCPGCGTDWGTTYQTLTPSP